MKKNSSTQLYKDIKTILIQARAAAYRAVNAAMVEAYWNVGRLIVEEEQRGKEKAEYGKRLIVGLSSKLTADFGKGFDTSNLWHMRQFYQLFPILDALRRELTWTHYRLLLSVESLKARNFYVKEAIAGNWSTRQLERQIHAFYYERLLSSRNKSLLRKDVAANIQKAPVTPQDFIKDPYVLEFLDLPDNHVLRESTLEHALIDHLQKFILELGRGFSFVGRQQRVSSETQHFFIDLVFYNYILKCFVLIDLKTGKLTHQDIGQLDMYVRLFDDKMRLPGDNSTIGIILCAQKDDTVVKYSVLNNNKKLFASKYKLYLPSEKELKNEIERERQILKLALRDKC